MATRAKRKAVTKLRAKVATPRMRAQAGKKPKRPMITGAQFVQVRTKKGMLSGCLHGVFWRVLAGQGLDAFVQQTWDELGRHLRPYKERSIVAVTWRWAIPVPPGARRGSFRTLLLPWNEAVDYERRGGGSWMRYRLLCAAHLLYERTERWRHGGKP